MDETILLPSPNWFLVSNLAVSTDGWFFYGGPSKSLCVLEPLKTDVGVIAENQKFQAHVITFAHPEKIVSLDISPDWLEKRSFISGSSDGSVKQWTIETVNNRIKIKATHSHTVHQQEKEEIAGIGYSTAGMAISVGCFGNVVKWDLLSNVAKSYTNFLRSMKPTCMSCSQHLPLQVAVGTKQGVVFVLDLNGNGKVLYKVRCHDDEVMNVSWCPQYDIVVNKTLNESKNRTILTSRLQAIRKEGEKELALEKSAIGKSLPDDSFDDSIVQEDDTFDIYKDHESDEFGHKKYVPEEVLVKVKPNKKEDDNYLAECLKLKEEILKMKNTSEPSIESLVEAMDKTNVAGEASVVDVKAGSLEEPSTGGVNNISEPSTEEGESNNIPSTSAVQDNTKNVPKGQASIHNHKHLMATIGKLGGVRIWSKTGKLVATCAAPHMPKNSNKKATNWPTLLWYKPETLLIVDGKSQLLKCNPLKIDCKNKLEWSVVHTLHKRGMFAIASNAPRIQTSVVDDSNWSVWSISQDRNIIIYNLKAKKILGIHATCGGFIYTAEPCPYDAGKIAVSVGDGAVRIWESSTLGDDDQKLTAPKITTYWQNVQGKVLSIAWHPTKENLLAFSTAEARVGLIDISGKSEKPARVLQSALSNAVYALCWARGDLLYASGGGALVMYRHALHDPVVEPLEVVVEGQPWAVSGVRWSPRGLLLGSLLGGVALLDATHHTLRAAAFVFTKMIHAMEWHPEQISSSSEESQYKDLIAVCSMDKEHTVVILQHVFKEDGTEQLTTWKTLHGHQSIVLQVTWSPHHDEQLLSTSQDSTVRVWNIRSGACISIFSHHSTSAICGSWLAWPQLSHCIMSGGRDSCLRLWNVNDHIPENHDESIKHEVLSKKQMKKMKKNNKARDEPTLATTTSTEVSQNEPNGTRVATNLEAQQISLGRASRKFIFPLMYKQINDPDLKYITPRKMLDLYLQKKGKNGEEAATGIDENGDRNGHENGVSENGDHSAPVDDIGDSVREKNMEAMRDSDKISCEILKIFGTIKEVNELLDMESQNHIMHGQSENWIMLSILRGHIHSVIQYASEHDMLCPFLLSIAPCVSFKYWKDTTQLYLAQIDRLVARDEDEKLYENKQYGGAVYRKVVTLLSIHDVKGAVAALVEGKLFKEAYILCRLRYMDSVAEQVLKQWADDVAYSGSISIAVVCYIALDNLSEAATLLSRSKDEEYLSLAADIAKVAGRNAFADHVAQKATILKKETLDNKTDEMLKELPSKIELLLKDDQGNSSNEGD